MYSGRLSRIRPTTDYSPNELDQLYQRLLESDPSTDFTAVDRIEEVNHLYLFGWYPVDQIDRMISRLLAEPERNAGLSLTTDYRGYSSEVGDAVIRSSLKPRAHSSVRLYRAGSAIPQSVRLPIHEPSDEPPGSDYQRVYFVDRSNHPKGFDRIRDLL